jgi:hypothetical protein
MARQIIEQWRLAVLRVRLDLAARTPSVATEMVGYPTGSAQTMWKRRHPIEAFGLSEAPPTALTVPTDLRDAVVETLVHDLNRDAALWLRLVPPYGYLGGVPWEATLIPATGLPLLRVPDRLPAAPELGRLWRIVVAISAPPPSTWAPRYIRSLAKQLGETVPAKVEVHVFADANTHAALRTDALPWVRLHDPEVAEAAFRDSTQRLTKTTPQPAAPVGQKWADWIIAGLGGRAVRALHVVLDGCIDVDRPLLRFSPDPVRPVSRSEASAVGAPEVLAFADKIGAAALSFGSPPGNSSDLATRMIADWAGQQRPGATIYSSIAHDRDGKALAQAHAFVIDRTGELRIPRHRSLFAYLQPEHMQASLEHTWPGLQAQGPDVVPAPLPGDDLADTGVQDAYVDAETVPTWVATSDRYLTKQWAGLAKRSTSHAPTAEFKGAYDTGAVEALANLRDIIKRHAGPS